MRHTLYIMVTSQILVAFFQINHDCLGNAIVTNENAFLMDFSNESVSLISTR